PVVLGPSGPKRQEGERAGDTSHPPHLWPAGARGGHRASPGSRQLAQAGPRHTGGRGHRCYRVEMLTELLPTLPAASDAWTDNVPVQFLLFGSVNWQAKGALVLAQRSDPFR